jgi:hypothetical protein
MCLANHVRGQSCAWPILNSLKRWWFQSYRQRKFDLKIYNARLLDDHDRTTEPCWPDAFVVILTAVEGKAL